MKQEFHLNLRNVKLENVRRTSILMNNSCIPSYVVCDKHRYKFCFHMEALNGVISLSAKFKNLNNIRRKHILRYVYFYFFILLTLPWTTFSELYLQSWQSLYIVSICMGHEGVDGVKTLSMVRLWANAFCRTCQTEMKISNHNDSVCILHLVAWPVIRLNRL